MHRLSLILFICFANKCVPGQLVLFYDEATKLKGLKNKVSGHVVFKPTFKQSDIYLNTYILSDSTGNFGVIDNKGEIILPFKFKRIMHGIPGKTKPYFLAQYSDLNDFLVYNINGKPLLPFSVSEIYPIYVEGDKSHNAKYFRYRFQDGKYGLLSNNFINLIPPIYDFFSINTYGPKKDWFWVKKENEYRLTDVYGTIYYSDTSQFKLTSFNEGLAPFWKGKNEKCGMVNEKIQYVIQPEFDVCLPFEGKASLVKKEIKSEDGQTSGALWGVIDRNGNYLIEPKYDELFLQYHFNDIGWWHHGYAVVLKNQLLPGGLKKPLYGMINSEGKEILAPDYEELHFDFNFYDIIVAKQNGKWGIMDLNGKTILPFQFSSVQTEFRDNEKKNTIMITYKRDYRPDEDGPYRMFFQQEEVHGFFDCRKKKLAIDPRRFDSVGDEFQWEFYLGCMDVEHQGRYGLVNKRGRYVIPTTYSYEELFFEDAEDDTQWSRFWKITPKIVKHWFIKDNWKGQH